MGTITDKPIQCIMSILLIRVVTDLAVHPDSGGCGEDGMVGTGGVICNLCCNVHVIRILISMFMLLHRKIERIKNTKE